MTVRNGKEVSLSQVFKELNLRAYDLNVDNLDVHAVSYNLSLFIFNHVAFTLG